MSGSPDYTTTPNLGLYRPNYDMDDGLWGTHLNANASVLDSAIGALQSGAGVISVLNHGAKGDGTTNDYNAIQGLLNSQPAATIYFPNTGHPYMTNGLVLYSNSDLLIHGTLKLIGGSNISLININNCSNISIRGHGILDGNGAAPGMTVGAGTLGGDSNTNIQIEGVTIQNAFDWNVNITKSSHVKITRVSIIGGQFANEFASGCDDCWITDSYISGPAQDGGFGFYGGVTNSGITNCVVKNAFATGIYVYSDSATTATQPPCANIVIANNVVYNNKTGGISTGNDGSVTGVHTGITITGNRCYANNNAANHLYADIWLASALGVTVVGNDLSGSGSGANATYGVFVASTSASVNVTGNTIWNEGQGGTAGGGVYIQAANNVLVEGNHFFDNQPTPTMAHAITGNAGADNAVIGNLFGTLGGAAISLVLASDTRLLDLTSLMMFATSSVAPPSFATRSAGTRLVLFPALTAGAADYAIGLDAGEMWFGVPGAAQQFNWFAGSTPIAALSGTGVFTATGGMSIPIGALGNYANDAAAATGGVAVGHFYRNGSILMVRAA